jgi:hypothetical protein
MWEAEEGGSLLENGHYLKNKVKQKGLEGDMAQRVQPLSSRP